MRLRIFAWTLSLLTLLGLTGAAQEPAVFSSVSELVVLQIAVTNKNGAFVEGLSQDAFRIFEDGQPQAIEFFLDRDAPVTIGLLLDGSGSMQGRRDLVRAAALAFAGESNTENEMFALSFNEEVRAMLPSHAPFTSDVSSLGEALTRGIAARGRTALFDALMVGLDYVALGHKDRRVLVVVSDGGDNVSRATFQDVLRKAQASNAVIHTVALFNPYDRGVNPRLLRELAAATGGRAFEAHDAHEVSDVLKDVARDIRNGYTVGYVSTNIGREGAIRRVRVAVEAPSSGSALVVRTRPGYWVKPPRGRQAE